MKSPKLVICKKQSPSKTVNHLWGSIVLGVIVLDIMLPIVDFWIEKTVFVFVNNYLESE